MNTQHKTAGVALVLLVCSWVAVPALGNELLHARISYESGGAMVQGTADDDWSYATINTLILPGDNLWADKGATVELEMSGGSFLRMADGSKAEVQSLPPNAAVRGWTGAFYVQRIARSQGGFLFVTPACRVEVEKDTQVRIDIVGNGATTVTVHWGKAFIRTEAGSPLRLLSGKRSYVDPGYLPSAPMPFDRSLEDSFDVWNRDRAKQLAVGQGALPEKVVHSYPIGGTDLGSYGEWVYVDNRNYWRPTVHTTTFVPYRRGYWSYVSGCGYVWVGDYPFSHVTSHYGHWSYRSGHGWLWSYGQTWSPAYAATYRYGNNFVWCPIDAYGRPVTYGDLHYTVGGVRLSMNASSFCLAADLLGGPCSASAVYPSIVSQRYGAEAYIWDLFAQGGTGRINTGRWGGAGGTLQVRDYSPRRVIRGPASSGYRPTPASARIATLEGTFGRASFTVVSKTGGRGIRTSMTGTARAARTRSARLDKEAPRLTSSMITRADRRSTSPHGKGESTRITSRRQPASAPGGSPVASSDRNSSSRNRVVVRGEAGTTSSSIRSTPRKVVELRSTPPSTSSRDRTDTSYRVNTSRQTTAPSRGTNRTQTSAPSASTRTPSRTTSPQRSISSYSPRTSAPSAPRTYQPSTPSRSTAPSTTRTPAPSSSSSRVRGYASTPSRTPSRTTVPTSPSQIPRRSAPSSAPSVRSTPRSVAPPSTSYKRSAPAPTRSAPSRSYSAPTRSTPRSVTPPSTSYKRSAPAPTQSAPSRSYSAPTRSAPSRSTSTPSRSTSTPTRSTPSRSSSSSSSRSSSRRSR